MDQDTKDFRVKSLAEMNEEERNNAIWSIYTVESSLRDIYLGSYERAVKSLFLLNAGGVVTILAYIYRSNESCATSLLTMSLISFLIGLISVFVVVIQDFFGLFEQMIEFNSDMKKFLINRDMPFNKIRQFQPKDKQLNTVNRKKLIGMVSIICVGAGLMLGLLGYFLS